MANEQIQPVMLDLCAKEQDLPLDTRFGPTPVEKLESSQIREILGRHNDNPTTAEELRTYRLRYSPKPDRIF